MHFGEQKKAGFKTDHMLNDGNNQGKVTKWVARIITKDSSKELLKFTTQQGSSANDYIGIKPTGNEGNDINRNLRRNSRRTCTRR